MSAPVVTRPPHSAVDEQDQKSGFAAEQVGQWARWIVLAFVILGAAGLIAVTVVTVGESKRTEQARRNWDHIHKALKDKNKPEELIAALEKVAPEVVGSPAHAYVLMQLGELHFNEALSPTKNPEDRAAGLKKAQQVFEIVATQEPYRSNAAFGPMAVEGLALAYEQNKEYDKAVSLLEENLKRWESHFLYNKMSAQLGRLYYLRSETREKPEDKEKDRTAAREKLSEVLRQGGTAGQGAWRDQAEFIKSLVDKPGKALPEGKAPPPKAPPAAAAPAPGAPPAPVTPDAKTTPPKSEEKKDEKKEEKKDEKKTGAIEKKMESEMAAGTTSGHLSFSQIQKMLKEGKTAFCECVRCTPGDETQAIRPFE
ncbi:MAG TPA: hypothetical protein VEK08_12970 [Planctomycetota bacterium]|nr:hypothetical protein [Planctomycetota bacterium]